MAEEQAMKQHGKTPLPFTNHVNDYKKLNVSQHLTYKHVNKKGDVIAVFDDLLSPHVVEALRKHIVRYGNGFKYSGYDPAVSETHDNVNMILPVEVYKGLNTPYWEAVKLMSHYLTNTSDWHPYDMSCNLIHHAHHSRIHKDCSFDEHEYTAVLYLNPDWNADLYGETIFLDQRHPEHEELEDSSFDFIAGVVPKYGRIVIFRNLILHSARPPSSSFLAARYTFPIKVSETRGHARAKMLMEALEDSIDSNDDNNNNNDDDGGGNSNDNNVISEQSRRYQALRNGRYDGLVGDDTRVWVEGEYNKRVAARENSVKELIAQYSKVLVPDNMRTDL